MNFAVTAENDVSQWNDKTGVHYHFPKRYRELLQPGTRIVYYKGKLKKKEFSNQRLSKEPHYFATAVIGKVQVDPASEKGDLYAEVVDFSPFKEPVLAKQFGEYLEEIPENRSANYWRDGARKITQSVYQKIVGYQHIDEGNPSYGFSEGEEQCAYTASTEGQQSYRVVSTYERDPQLRRQALKYHGFSCKACGFDFEAFYGEYGAGYIEVHHIEPLSQRGGPVEVDPQIDLVPLCANCHAVVHRRRDETLSLEQLKEKIAGNTA